MYTAPRNNNYLCHKSSTHKKHKYIAKVKQKNGKYRYFYEKNEYMQYLRDTGQKPDPDIIKKFNNTGNISKNTVDKKALVANGQNAVTGFLARMKRYPSKLLARMSDRGKRFVENMFNKGAKAIESMPKYVNKGISKVNKIVKKVYDDPKNKFDINPHNYKKKIAQVKKTKEWKDIVKRKDPEYTRVKEDGTTEYLIDDYIAKKKYPIADIVSDITSNRKVTLNKIEKDSVVAGLKASVFGTIALGMLGANIAANFIIEKAKFYQGSYQDEIKDMKKRADRGAEYVNAITNETRQIKPSDVEQVVKMVENEKKRIQKEYGPIDKNKIEKAARILREQDDSISTSEMQKILGTLSEEELRYLRMRMGKQDFV